MYNDPGAPDVPSFDVTELRIHVAHALLRAASPL